MPRWQKTARTPNPGRPRPALQRARTVADARGASLRLPRPLLRSPGTARGRRRPRPGPGRGLQARSPGESPGLPPQPRPPAGPPRPAPVGRVERPVPAPAAPVSLRRLSIPLQVDEGSARDAAARLGDAIYPAGAGAWGGRKPPSLRPARPGARGAGRARRSLHAAPAARFLPLRPL